MVSLFGLKLGGDKKKKAEEPGPEERPQWQRIDQNLLGEGQYFGTHLNRQPHDSNSVRSDPRPETARAQRKRSVYVHDTHNLAAASMFDLSQLRHGARRSSIVSSAPGSSAASTRFQGSSTSGTNVTVPTPPFLFPSRPGTPTSGRTKPWVNPLDVHFCRTTPSDPPQAAAAAAAASPRLSPLSQTIILQEPPAPQSPLSQLSATAAAAAAPRNATTTRRSNSPEVADVPEVPEVLEDTDVPKTEPAAEEPPEERIPVPVSITVPVPVPDSPPILAAFPSPPRSVKEGKDKPPPVVDDADGVRKPRQTSGRARLSKKPPAAKVPKAASAPPLPMQSAARSASASLPSPPESFMKSSGERPHTNPWSGKSVISGNKATKLDVLLPRPQLSQPQSFSADLLAELERSLGAAHTEMRDRPHDAVSVSSSSHHYSGTHPGPARPQQQQRQQADDLRQPRPAFASSGTAAAAGESRNSRSQSPMNSRNDNRPSSRGQSPHIGAAAPPRSPLMMGMGPPSGPRNASPFRGRRPEIVLRRPPILRPKSERITPAPSMVMGMDPAIPPVPSLSNSPFLRPLEDPPRDISSVRSLDADGSSVSRDPSRGRMTQASEAGEESGAEVLMGQWERPRPAPVPVPVPFGQKSPTTPASAPLSSSAPTQPSFPAHRNIVGPTSSASPGPLALPPSPDAPNWPFPSSHSAPAARSPTLAHFSAALPQSKRSPPPMHRAGSTPALRDGYLLGADSSSSSSSSRNNHRQAAMRGDGTRTPDGVALRRPGWGRRSPTGTGFI